MSRKARSIKIITETRPLGPVVSAVVVEYNDIISPEKVSPSIYEVKANRLNEFGGDLGNRNITRVYTNNRPVQTDTTTPGKYVIIELYTQDPNALVLFHKEIVEGGFNYLYDLEYTVLQKENIESSEGSIIAAGVISGGERVDPVADKFKTSIYKNHNKELPYGLALPDNYDHAKEYPLVLYLHGAGERGNNNLVNIPANKGSILWAEDSLQAENPCFVLAPQCPTDSSWTGILADGGPFEPTVHLEMVHELLMELLNEYSIDKNRLYCTGLSMGGFGTWALNISYPETFAAMVPICGGGDPEQAEFLADKPIWNFHAEDDAVVDVSYSRDMVNALKNAGSNVIYTEYDIGVVSPPLAPFPHFTWVPAYNDKKMIEWLFTQEKKSK